MRRVVGRFLGGAFGCALLACRGLAVGADPSSGVVAAEVYGGGGRLSLSNNETDPTELTEEHAGVASFAELALGGGDPHQPSLARGAFALLGASYELRGVRQVCAPVGPLVQTIGIQCGEPVYSWQSYVGGRLGFDYRWRRFELRAGAVASLPLGQTAWSVNPLLFPDVWVRFGARDRDFVELGLGAYDASTIMRPGAFVGGGIVASEQVRVMLHVGLNAGNGSLGGSVPQLGERADIGLQVRLTERVEAGLTAALQAYGDMGMEGTAHVRVLL